MGVVLRLVSRTTIRLVVKARRIQWIKQTATPQFCAGSFHCLGILAPPAAASKWEISERGRPSSRVPALVIKTIEFCTASCTVVR
jgi:hypothetical protein